MPVPLNDMPIADVLRTRRQSQVRSNEGIDRVDKLVFCLRCTCRLEGGGMVGVTRTR